MSHSGIAVSQEVTIESVLTHRRLVSFSDRRGLRRQLIWYSFDRCVKRCAFMKYTEWIGWISSTILLLTLMRQVYTQWRSRTAAGVSRWLFVGQVTASVGFTVYSILVHNWVFTCSNIAILATAVVGECIFLRNRQPGGDEGHETA